MDLSYTALEPEIAAQVAVAKLLKPAATNRIANILHHLHLERFLNVQKITGVPALWLMPVFERESGLFTTYFGNGDPLDKPTTHVPKGRGPFASWEAGAIDALVLDHITHVEEWNWTQACYQWEKWNGFGPRGHGRPSGYVWSWTDQYHGGKYIKDGPGGWSKGTWDLQCGCFAIAKALVNLDATLNFEVPVA